MTTAFYHIKIYIILIFFSFFSLKYNSSEYHDHVDGDCCHHWKLLGSAACPPRFHPMGWIKWFASAHKVAASWWWWHPWMSSEVWLANQWWHHLIFLWLSTKYDLLDCKLKLLNISFLAYNVMYTFS